MKNYAMPGGDFPFYWLNGSRKRGRAGERFSGISPKVKVNWISAQLLNTSLLCSCSYAQLKCICAQGKNAKFLPSCGLHWVPI